MPITVPGPPTPAIQPDSADLTRLRLLENRVRALLAQKGTITHAALRAALTLEEN